MKITGFFKDKLFNLILYLIAYGILLSMLFVFHVSSSLILAFTIVYAFLVLLIFLYEYYRRKYFYKQLFNNLKNLDEKYLISEMIREPNFLDGKILCQVLYETNKSMKENVNDYEFKLNDFKEYIETWIHEVKLPLATLTLKNHNSKNKSSIKEIKKIDNYVEQVLYYARSENSEKDYLIKEISLKKVIHKLALENKDAFLENNVTLEVDITDIKVLTDAKWLEFIINQIISNSLKYYRKDVDSFVKITAFKNEDKTILSIYDNGIGISKTDLPQVFNKSFTGNNGRIINSSTGMGLYIAKKMCLKLGHEITIESKVGEYTKVNIIFYNNDYFAVLK